jgi:hypothetical protein
MHDYGALIIIIIGVIGSIADAISKARAKKPPTLTPPPVRPSTYGSTSTGAPPGTYQGISGPAASQLPSGTYQQAQYPAPGVYKAPVRPSPGTNPSTLAGAPRAVQPNPGWPGQSKALKTPQQPAGTTAAATLARARQQSDAEYAQNYVAQNTNNLVKPASISVNKPLSYSKNQVTGDAARKLINGVIWAEVLAAPRCKTRARSI